MDPFDPYSSFKFLNFSLLAFYRAYILLIKYYNNHSVAYIAGTQNSTCAYIVIIASLQALVNNLLVWQSSCESKLCPLNLLIQLLVNVQLIIRTSIRILIWCTRVHKTKTSLHFSYYSSVIFMEYSRSNCCSCIVVK